MRRNPTIALALAVVAAALALPGSALPQALIIGTNGQPGDGKHIIAPVSAEQQNGDASVSVDVGSGDGSAANTNTTNGDDGASAVVGCLNGAAVAGDSALTGNAGNCGPGNGRAAKGHALRDDAVAGPGLGCVALGRVGPTSGGTQAASCRAAGGGSGALSDSAGAERRNNSGGSDAEGSQDSGACGGIRRLASLAGPGSMPAWLLALGALGAFGSGAFFARRRSSSTLG